MMVKNVAMLKTKESFMLNSLLVFILIHSYVPFVGFYTPAFVYAAVIMLAYAVAFALIGGNRLFKLLTTVIPLFLINVLEILFHAISGQGNAFTELYGLAQNLLPAICTLFFMRQRNKKLANKLLSILIISCVFTSVTTYIGCQDYPNASRNLATNIREDNISLYVTYMQHNIGGFNFIYTLTLLIPIVIYLAKNHHLNYILSIIMVVAFVFAIKESEYTTALLLSIIGLLSYVMPARMGWRKMRGVLLLIVFGCITLFDIAPHVLRYVASSTESVEVSGRLNDLANVMSGDGSEVSSDSDLNSRQDKFQQSWDSFVNSNFLGGWSQAKVGGHSYILDILGRYGIWGLILLLIMYTKLLKLYLKPYKRMPWYGYQALVISMAIIQAILNTDNCFPFMCLVFPLFSLVVQKKKINSLL